VFPSLEQPTHLIHKLLVVPGLLGKWRRQRGLRRRGRCISSHLIDLPLEQNWGPKYWMGVSQITPRKLMVKHLRMWEPLAQLLLHLTRLAP